MDTVNSVGETARVRGELVTVNEVASDIEAGEGAMDLAAGLSVCQVAAFEVMTTGGDDRGSGAGGECGAEDDL